MLDGAPRPGGRDRIGTAGTVLLFSTALGLGTVVVPLFALNEGFDGADVGLLVGLSALSQMAARIGLGAALRRYSDRSFLVVSAVLLAGGFLMLSLSHDIIAFAVAMLFDGLARALFWTGSQTHVVRGAAPSAAPLAEMNFFSAVGMTVGPLLGGLLSQHSSVLALLVAAGIAMGCLTLTPLVWRHPTFPAVREHGTSRVWRHRGVNAGCWANASAGAWRALLRSFVPVALDQARQSAGTIGALMSLTNLATLFGSSVVARIAARHEPLAFVTALVAAAAGIGLTALVAGNLVIVAGLLVLCGLGGGALQTLAPAVAVDRADAERRGDVIALTGVFRSAAAFAGPVGVAGLIGVLPLAAALGVASLVLTVPVCTARQLLRRTGETPC